MAGLTSWKVVRDADSDSVILAVDFPLTGRPEASFVDLSSNLTTEHAIWQTAPPLVRPGSGLTGVDYVEKWVAEIENAGVHVSAVLGFCIGSVYGAALTEQISAWQSTPRLVLLDPEPATMDTLYWQFEKMVRNLDTVLTDDEMSTLRERATDLRETAGTHVVQFAVELFEIFERVAADGLTRSGLDGDRSGELIGLFASLISYLSAADDLVVDAEWKRAVAISSTSEHSGLNARRLPNGGTSEIVAEEIQVDFEHSELLRSPEVASVVSGLL